MKTIIITKDTPDMREGNYKTKKEGTEITCAKELAEKYLEAGVADEVGAAPKEEKKVRTKKIDK